MKSNLKNQLSSFCENPKFLGVVFDESSNFNQFQNLKIRTLKRLKLIKLIQNSK